MSTVLVIFTSKSKSDILELGGTGWWKVNSVKASKASHVLLVHNAHDPRKPGNSEQHGLPFLLATIRDLRQDEIDGRWLIQFDSVADASGGFQWPGYRNPIAYMNDDEILGLLEVGDWENVTPVDFRVALSIRHKESVPGARTQAEAFSGVIGNTSRSFGQVLDDHRNQIALELGIEPTQVRITVGTG